MQKRINIWLLFVMLFLLFLSVIYMLNQKSINLGVRYILEWDKLNLAIWLWVSISFFIHYLSEKDNKNYYSGLIYKDFGIFADSFFAAITYGLAATTSTAILKGVYIQQFFGDVVYFNNFSSIDISSMLVVCIFLFGYSSWASLKAIGNAIVVGTSEEAVPVHEENTGFSIDAK